MYLDEAAEIFAYWERNPPVYQITAIIAQMLGWKPQRDEDRGAEPEPIAPAAAAAPIADLQALMSVPGVAHQRTPDWARGAVLDFEQLKRMRAGGSDG
jgi:hypothetical protein